MSGGYRRGRDDVGRNHRRGKYRGLANEVSVASGEVVSGGEGIKKRRSGSQNFLNAAINQCFADFLSHETDIIFGVEIGEKTLLRAVIYRAVLDACQARSSVSPAERDCARRWLASSAVEPYSYEWCCDYLNIEDWARRAIRTAHKCPTLDIERMTATPRGGH